MKVDIKYNFGETYFYVGRDKEVAECVFEAIMIGGKDGCVKCYKFVVSKIGNVYRRGNELNISESCLKEGIFVTRKDAEEKAIEMFKEELTESKQ